MQCVFQKAIPEILIFKGMKHFFILLFVLFSGQVFSQLHLQTDTLTPPATYENVYAHPVQHDSLQSVFVIWIKKEVKMHYHQDHTESVIILDGRATMLLDGKVMEVKKGDYIFIPKQTPHAVTKVHGRKPLKVLSIQAPYFDGKDRILVE